MRDSGYLAMLSASDRQRLLLFFITLRITASTQEAIACLFESSPPQLAEQMRTGRRAPPPLLAVT